MATKGKVQSKRISRNRNLRLSDLTSDQLAKVKEVTKIPMTAFVELAVDEKIKRDKINIGKL